MDLKRSFPVFCSALALLIIISMPPAFAGELFVAADIEDFDFPEGTTSCPDETL